MFKKINHIAVATTSVDKAYEIFSSLFGFSKEDTLVDRKQGVKAILIRSNDVLIELIEPTDPGGDVAGFLMKRGSGLHHVSFEVDDLNKVLKSLESKGVTLINREPHEIGNYRVVFVHPKSVNGLLIELLEKKASITGS